LLFYETFITRYCMAGPRAARPVGAGTGSYLR